MNILSHGNTPIRYDKEHTHNHIAKLLYHKYKSDLLKLIPNDNIDNILEIGCGKGEILNFIDSKHHSNLCGVDIEDNVVNEASALYPNIMFNKEDGKNLSFQDNSFDLVLVLEVLEHVEEVYKIIIEAKRICNRYCIFSVPREPLWRVLNFIRGAYVSKWGNRPGHLNHWNS